MDIFGMVQLGIFQSTLPRGERLDCNIFFLYRQEFQSTLPRGERRFRESSFQADAEFQSTLPRGERLEQCRKTLVNGEISIHAPARGATELRRIGK